MIDSKIILGSKSPRRKELLEGLGYSFEIRTKDTDESYPLTIPSLEVAKFIALQKANALISDLKSNQIGRNSQLWSTQVTRNAGAQILRCLGRQRALIVNPC